MLTSDQCGCMVIKTIDVRKQMHFDFRPIGLVVWTVTMEIKKQMTLENKCALAFNQYSWINTQLSG